MGKLLDRASSECLLLPEGQYRVVFQDWEVLLYLGKAPKICAEFKIVDYGEFFEKSIYRWWNVKPTRSKLSKNCWKVGKSSNLYRDYCEVTLESPKRLDRIPLTRLENHIALADVKTVKEARDQTIIPEAARYSVICGLNRIRP